MNNRIREALLPVRAEPALRARTRAAVEAEIARRSRRRFHRLPALAATCAAVLLVAVGGWRVWSAPHSRISVDVNPSLELTLNRWDTVVAVQAYNSDAVPLAALPLAGKRYDAALDLLLQEEALGGYLDGDARISFTVQSNGTVKEGQLLEALTLYTDHHLAGVRADCAAVDGALVREAHAHGLSAGKYRTLLELLEADPDATLDQWRDRSMGELHDYIDACHGAGGGAGQGQGGGHGRRGRHHGGA